MGRYSGKSCRIICMLTITASFFFVEITVGFIVNSLALVGDSYHMLSDVVALFVGLASVRISKWSSQKNTYGWARAEVLGALINAVFLIALCFTIFVEALQRLAGDEHIHNPDLMLIVGAIGLAVNLVGLVLFHGHAHSHGGGGHGHSHGSPEKKALKSSKESAVVAEIGNGEAPGANRDSDPDQSSSDDDDDPGAKALRSSAQLNMRGVFLHVLGDALGSVVVIISALVIKYVDAHWTNKVDPAMSLILVIIILSTSIPLLKESALILLQTVPTHITVKDLQEKLVGKVEGVLAIHEFHIWQLAGNRIIASAHIRCQNLRDYMRIAEEVKSFFHNEGIHSTTIQPEFAECLPEGNEFGSPVCFLECCETKEVRCCPQKMMCQSVQPPIREEAEELQDYGGGFTGSCSSIRTEGSCNCIGSKDSSFVRAHASSFAEHEHFPVLTDAESGSETEDSSDKTSETAVLTDQNYNTNAMASDIKLSSGNAVSMGSLTGKTHDLVNRLKKKHSKENLEEKVPLVVSVVNEQKGNQL